MEETTLNIICDREKFDSNLVHRISFENDSEALPHLTLNGNDDIITESSEVIYVTQKALWNSKPPTTEMDDNYSQRNNHVMAIYF